MASSLSEAKDDERASALLEKTEAKADRTGSDRYQDKHMGKIFGDGFSFSGFERNRVYIARGDGTYADLSDISGGDSPLDCRGTAVADFDDDGDPDVFINSIQRESHLLLRNDAGSTSGHGFLKLRLAATHGNPQAIGAVVEVRTPGRVQSRVLACGSGFESQDSLECIFGLGSAERAAVTVRWPGREAESFGELAAGGRHWLTEGTGKARTYTAQTFRFADPAPRGIRVRVGDTLPLVKLRDLDGEHRALELASDRPTLLNFWATTCVTCLAEMPQLRKLHEDGKARVVCVSLDPADRAARVAELAERFGMSERVASIAETEAEKLFDLGRLAIPVTLVVSPEGKILSVHQGRLPEED